MRAIIYYLFIAFVACSMLIEPSLLIVPYVIAMGQIPNQGYVRTHNISINGRNSSSLRFTKKSHFNKNRKKSNNYRRRKGPIGARPYKNIGGDYFNCYGYALGIIKWTDPGNLYYNKLGLIPPVYYNYFDNVDVEKFANYVIKDLESLGRSGRIIIGPDDAINSNEYRIAMRTGSHGYDWEGNLNANYHFMIQHSDGSWSDKYGQGLSRHLAKGINPSMISWDLPSWDSKHKQKVVFQSGVGYFDSQTVYLAVTN